MGQGALNYQGVKSGIKLNDIIEDFKYVYKGQTIKAGDLVNYINGVAGKVDYGESVDVEISKISQATYGMSAVALDESRIFIAHSNSWDFYLYGVVCTISGGTITYGADTQLSTITTSGAVVSCVLLPNGKIFIAHSYNSYTLYGMICSIDGNTIITGIDTGISTGTSSTLKQAGYKFSTYLLPNGNVFIAHSAGDSRYLYGIVCTISDTTIKSGTDTQLSTATYTGYTISTCLLPNGNVFIAHSYGSSYYLYGIVCTISGTTITKGSDTALVSSISRVGVNISTTITIDNRVFIAFGSDNSSSPFFYAMICDISGTTITGGGFYSISNIGTNKKLSTVLLNDGSIFVAHTYGSDSQFLYGIVCTISGTAISYGVDTALVSINYAGYAISTCLLPNGTIFVAHSNSSNYYLNAQIFAIDNNVPTSNIVITEYEQQVTQALEPPFNAVALSSGVGAPEFVEVTGTDNIFAKTWKEVTVGTKYSSDDGYVLEASSYTGDKYVSNACTGSESDWWYSANSTEAWIMMTCPNPTLITKMKIAIAYNSPDSVISSILQGSTNKTEWINLYDLTHFYSDRNTSLTEVNLENANHYKYYRVITKYSTATPIGMIEWQTSEYTIILPSTEHNEQVKIARVPNKLSSLPVGALVKDVNSTFLGEPVVWKIADKNHEGYPNNSVTLIADRNLAMRAFDAKEPNNSNSARQSYGNNRYSVSNIRQWLNSDAEAGQWYSAQHSADTPPNSSNVFIKDNIALNPYDTNAGFLNGFSEDFKNSLLQTNLTVALNTVTDGGGSETVTDKIFLASNTEVGIANENNITEGTLLPIFSDNESRIAYCTSKCLEDSDYKNAPSSNNGWYWWLRTPTSSATSDGRTIDMEGIVCVTGIYYGNYGVRPLCNISSSIRVSEEPDEDGCYTLLLGGAN